MDAAPCAGRRPGRAVGLLFALLACCALLAPAAAEAQAVHVTNLGQSDDAELDPNYIANSFKTGGTTTDRFTLTSVVIDFASGSGTPTWVRVYTTSSGSPGTQIGSNLVKQGSGTSGNITYNAPSGGIAFNGGTRYYVVVNTGAATAVLTGTSSNNEDSSSTSGWTIGQFAQRSSNANDWTADPNSYAMRFRVNANVVVSLSADKVTQTGARLTISGHSAAWYYKSTAASATCSTQVAMGTTQVTLSSLTANSAYTYKAYSNSTCSTELTTNASDAEFTTLDLTATNIGQTTARVSIVNHTGGWHLRRTAPSTGTCVPLSGSQHFQNLINLTANTSYTYRAYLSANCPTSSELASVTFMTLAPSDTTPPSVITGGYSPADNATGVATNANLVLTFNEAVQKGTGNVVIRTGTNTDVTIDVTSNQVSVGGTGNTVVTINPTNDLGASTAYRVRIPAGAFKDSANNNYAGINDDTTWNFETAAAPDTTPPQLASNPFNPADNATGVARNANLRVTFNESVQRDTSRYIRLWAAGAGSSTPITVGISGAVVTIAPDSDLSPHLEHSIWFEAGAIKDLAGNDFAGFENPTTWNFTTGSTTVTPVTPVTPGGGGGSVSPPRPNRAPAFGDMTPLSLTLVQHETLTPLILPAATSGDGALAYTLAPALPAGLEFDAETRTLSGAPAAAQDKTRYTLTAEDEDYDIAELSFTLAVLADRRPGFGDMTVADRTFQLQARRQGQPPGQPGQRRARVRPQTITPLSLPAATGGNPPLTYALTPAPPPGLVFDAATRTIRGTPTAVQPATPYRYTATDNDGDTATLTFTLAVTAPGPSRTEQQVVSDTMAELGRATLAGAADVIKARLNTPSGDTGLVLAGRALPLTSGPVATTDVLRSAGATDPWHETVYAGAVTEGATTDLDELLRDSAFSVSLNRDNAETAPDTPALTLWGRSYARRYFTGQSGSGGWDGAARDSWLGLDARLPGSGLLAGLAVARNEGGADYRYIEGESHRGGEGNGELDTSLTTLWPYLSKPLSGGGHVQLMLGAGRGELTRRAGEADSDGDENGDADRIKTKANLGLLAGVLGGSRPFARTHGVTVSALGEASAVRLATGESEDAALAEQSLLAWRVRGGIEARHAGILLPVRDWLLSPHGTVAVRHDGGDGVTGAGMELAGGLSLTGPGSRWRMTLDGHWLALHAAQGRREWGVSMDVQLNSLPGGLGWLFSVSPRWGSARDVNALAGENVFASSRFGTGDIHGTDGIHGATSLAAQLGYGMHAFGGRFTLTPALDIDVSGTGREVGIGWQLTPRNGTNGHARPLTLFFEAVRRETRHLPHHPSDPSNLSSPTDHDVWLRLEAGY